MQVATNRPYDDRRDVGYQVQVCPEISRKLKQQKKVLLPDGSLHCLIFCSDSRTRRLVNECLVFAGL